MSSSPLRISPAALSLNPLTARRRRLIGPLPDHRRCDGHLPLQVENGAGFGYAIFIPIVGLSIGSAIHALSLPAMLSLRPQVLWNIVILGYCFVASIIPVWILLQPRGYLGGFFLYVTLALASSTLFRRRPHSLSAFIGFTSEKGLPLFPILFVTVACGAAPAFMACKLGNHFQTNREGAGLRAVGYGECSSRAWWRSLL